MNICSESVTSILIEFKQMLKAVLYIVRVLHAGLDKTWIKRACEFFYDTFCYIIENHLVGIWPDRSNCINVCLAGRYVTGIFVVNQEQKKTGVSPSLLKLELTEENRCVSMKIEDRSVQDQF